MSDPMKLRVKMQNSGLPFYDTLIVTDNMK